MKYVMFEIDCKPMKTKIPVIFPQTMIHSEVASAFKQALIRQYGKDVAIKIVSAGEFNVMNSECYGSSSTLGVDSLPVDGNIILGHDYFHGIMPDEEPKE